MLSLFLASDRHFCCANRALSLSCGQYDSSQKMLSRQYTSCSTWAQGADLLCFSSPIGSPARRYGIRSIINDLLNRISVNSRETSTDGNARGSENDFSAGNAITLVPANDIELLTVPLHSTVVLELLA
jgi:hypothetical protein